MTVQSFQLLKRLEPAVRPVAPPSFGAKPQASLETQGFNELLKLAAGGQIHSGRQIALSFEPAQPLESSQLERMADAADQAESAGMSRALMMIDGRAFVLDVKNRTLVAEVSTGAANLVPNIDGAVIVGGAEGQPHQIKWPSGIVAQPPQGSKLFATPQKV